MGDKELLDEIAKLYEGVPWGPEEMDDEERVYLENRAPEAVMRHKEWKNSMSKLTPQATKPKCVDKRLEPAMDGIRTFDKIGGSSATLDVH